jgi:hypothetical protein
MFPEIHRSIAAAARASNQHQLACWQRKGDIFDGAFRLDFI